MVNFETMHSLFLYSSILILLLLSCTSENKTAAKPKNFDPTKKINSETKVETDIKPDSLLFWKLRYLSDSVGIKLDSVLPSFSRHFIDRFNAKSTLKNKLYINKDSVIHLKWIFSDSNSKKNALYNWLDCFGQNCMSIKMFESFKSEKQNVFIFINQRSLSLVASRQALVKENWMNFEKTNFPKDSMQFLIVQQASKNSLWYRFEKDKFKLLKK